MAYRLEWRHPLGVVTLAFFFLGASTFSMKVFPSHQYVAQSFAVLATFVWLVGVLKLGLFPLGRERATGAAFSYLQAVIEAAAFFVLMLVVLCLSFGISRFGVATAAIVALAVGIYSGTTPRKPPAPALVFKGKDNSR